MRYDSKIKKIEREVNAIRQKRGGLRMIFKEEGETVMEALARAGITDADATEVLIFRWSTKDDQGISIPKTYASAGTAPALTAREIDAKIEKVKRELLAGGMTAQELAMIESKYRDRKRI